MRNLLAVLVVFLVVVSGAVFLLSCGDGGDGGSAAVDLDKDGYDSSVDCDDNASSCTNDCFTDVDGDSIPDCMDFCLDMDLDGYGEDNTLEIVGDGSIEAGSCTQNGTTPCVSGGVACLGIDCDDELPAGFSINPAAAELCGDWIDNNCDGLTDCYDETACASDPACSACTDTDADGYFAVDAACSGGNDCNDLNSDINPGGIGAFGCPTPLCSTCNVDEDCGPGNHCILLDNAMVCVMACSDQDTCPEGFACDGSGQCIPTSGSCQCLPANDGEERPCSVSNVNGTCSGNQTCDALVGWTSCTASTPQAESCDGLDNDCDGEVDENYSDLGDDCTAGIGECQRSGSIICTDNGQGTECSAVAGMPNIELCDGLDNDCNGQSDDNPIALLCPEQDGVCTGSRTSTCNGTLGWAECTATDYGLSYEAVETTCDGLDNDCDGQIDNSLMAACEKQMGVCAGATKTCTGGSYLACEAADYGLDYENVEISCDGLDNDCDGQVDEGTCGLGAACITNLQCESGYCADGYCCSTSCAGTCQSCGIPGMVGTCAYYPAGTDPENECAVNCDGAGGCT